MVSGCSCSANGPRIQRNRPMRICGDTADFSTYQMVLEAGRKQVSQTGFVPESTLRLFA